jgi:hypothetical protein
MSLTMPPYTDEPRSELATIVSSPHMVADTLALPTNPGSGVLRRYQIPPQTLGLAVVTENCSAIPGSRSFCATPSVREFLPSD